MSLYGVCQWLEGTVVGAGVRDSSWLFPVIESVHILGIVLFAGVTSLLDFRLLGHGLLRKQPVSRVTAQLYPWMWIGFTIMFLTGICMFVSEATRCYSSYSFRIKMLLIVAAGINAAAFQFTAYRHVAAWDESPVTPAGAKWTAWLSLVLWACVVFAGRGIAYF